MFGSIEVDYKLALNIIGALVFTALLWLTARRGAIDPVCGMAVDRGKALTVTREGQTHYFCSEHCRSRFTGEHHGTRDDGSHSAEHATTHPA